MFDKNSATKLLLDEINDLKREVELLKTMLGVSERAARYTPTHTSDVGTASYGGLPPVYLDTRNLTATAYAYNETIVDYSAIRNAPNSFVGVESHPNNLIFELADGQRIYCPLIIDNQNEQYGIN